MERKRIIKLYINLISYEKALSNVIDLAKQRISSYACFVNGHMSIEAYDRKEFAEYVNNATFVLADGKPLAIALRLLYGVKQDRIAGMDFMLSVLTECAKNNLSVFLFGSTDFVLEELKKRIEQNHPDLRIAGSISPSFSEFSEEETANYIGRIKESNANIVLVGMGCPKQETWMAKNLKYIDAPLLGVGGAFSVYAGLVKRSPFWMQKFSLEWLYRLIQEPRRMWKRYLITNTLFICLIIRDLIVKMFSRKNDF